MKKKLLFLVLIVFVCLTMICGGALTVSIPKFSANIVEEMLPGGGYSGSWWDNAANGFMGGDGSRWNPYLIGNAAQLAYFSEEYSISSSSENRYFALADNINLSGHYWDPIGRISKVNSSTITGFAFRGNFDGRGYTISNMICAPPGKFDNSISAESWGLFGYTINANISNFTIKNSYLTFYNDKDQNGYNRYPMVRSLYLGLVVGLATQGSTVSNVVVEESKISYSGYTDLVAYANGYVRMGGIVGYSDESKIEDCYVYGNDTLVFDMQSQSKALTGYLHIGGIVGQMTNNSTCYRSGNYSRILLEFTTILNEQYSLKTIQDSARFYMLHIGGIAGSMGGYLHESTMEDSSNGITLADCIFSGSINTRGYFTNDNANPGNIKIGGIVGLGKGYVSECVNYSDINISDAGGKYIGGIVGSSSYSTKKLSILSCANFGTLNLKYGHVGAAGCYGGIIGYWRSGDSDNSNSYELRVEDCANYGNVLGSNSNTIFQSVGGIGGLLLNNAIINRCINVGLVAGHTNVGGIVGQIGSEDYSSGWFGSTTNYVDRFLVVNCFNLAKGSSISGSTNVGTIAGWAPRLKRDNDVKFLGNVQWSSLYKAFIGNLSSETVPSSYIKNFTSESSAFSKSAYTTNDSNTELVDVSFRNGFSSSGGDFNMNSNHFSSISADAKWTYSPVVFDYYSRSDMSDKTGFSSRLFLPVPTCCIQKVKLELYWRKNSSEEYTYTWLSYNDGSSEEGQGVYEFIDFTVTATDTGYTNWTNDKDKIRSGHFFYFLKGVNYQFKSSVAPAPMVVSEENFRLDKLEVKESYNYSSGNKINKHEIDYYGNVYFDSRKMKIDNSYNYEFAVYFTSNSQNIKIKNTLNGVENTEVGKSSLSNNGTYYFLDEISFEASPEIGYKLESVSANSYKKSNFAQGDVNQTFVSEFRYDFDTITFNYVKVEYSIQVKYLKYMVDANSTNFVSLAGTFHFDSENFIAINSNNEMSIGYGYQLYGSTNENYYDDTKRLLSKEYYFVNINEPEISTIEVSTAISETIKTDKEINQIYIFVVPTPIEYRINLNEYTNTYYSQTYEKNNIGGNLNLNDNLTTEEIIIEDLKKGNEISVSATANTGYVYTGAYFDSEKKHWISEQEQLSILKKNRFEAFLKNYIKECTDGKQDPPKDENGKFIEEININAFFDVDKFDFILAIEGKGTVKAIEQYPNAENSISREIKGSGPEESQTIKICYFTPIELKATESNKGYCFKGFYILDDKNNRLMTYNDFYKFYNNPEKSLSSIQITAKFEEKTTVEGKAPKFEKGIYYVDSVENLQWLSNQVGNGNSFEGFLFKQTCDITFSADNNFVPIGFDWKSSYSDETATNVFKGVYDGGLYSIKNFTASYINLKNVGLFGQCNGATLKNIVIEGGSVSGFENVGVLVGQAIDTKISNIYIKNSYILLPQLTYYNVYAEEIYDNFLNSQEFDVLEKYIYESSKIEHDLSEIEAKQTVTFENDYNQIKGIASVVGYSSGTTSLSAVASSGSFTMKDDVQNVFALIGVSENTVSISQCYFKSKNGNTDVIEKLANGAIIDNCYIEGSSSNGNKITFFEKNNDTLWQDNKLKAFYWL